MNKLIDITKDKYEYYISPDYDSIRSPELINNHFKLPKKLTRDILNKFDSKELPLYILFISSYLVLLKKYTIKKEISISIPNFIDNNLESFWDITYFHEEEDTLKDVLLKIKQNILTKIKGQLSIRHTNSNYCVNFKNLTQKELDKNAVNNGINLSVSLIESEIIECEFIYNIHNYTKERISFLIESYLEILNKIINEEHTLVSEMSIVGSEEVNRIHKINNNFTSDSRYTKIQDILEESATRFPNNIAISDETKSLTYHEFNNMTDRFAKILKKIGVNPGDIVAVNMEQSTDLLVIIFGILKSGAAYLPISPEYPEQRIKYILEDSNAKLMICTEKKSHSVKQLLLSKELFYEPVNDITLPKNINSNLAYIIYTSGTTGNPKGVIINHSSVINILEDLQSKYPLNEDDSFLLKTAFTFDVSVTELFGWMWNGGSLYIIPNQKLKNTKDIVDVIATKGITHINFSPTLLKYFLTEVEKQSYEYNHLKFLFSAGEELPLELAKLAKKLLPTTKIINLYGPTECTIYTTHYPLDFTSDKVYIGKPLQNIEIYVLDKSLNIQPFGVPGELFIGGLCLSPGYINNKKLNDEKFINSPFKKGEKLFKTGDEVIFHSNGNLEFLGRKGDLIKIRGLRIELGEIESLIHTHTEVENFALKVITKGEHKHLCLYYSSVNNKEIDLRTYLEKYLPKYMVPSFIVYMDKIPVTINGKIDKTNLPDPFIRNNSHKSNFINKNEKILANVWEKILGVDCLERNDNFFKIGGNSLSMLDLIKEISLKFNINLNIEDIYKYPTIKDLSSHIDKYFVKNNSDIYIRMEEAFEKEFLQKGSIKIIKDVEGKELSQLISKIPREKVRYFFQKNNFVIPHFILNDLNNLKPYTPKDMDFLKRKSNKQQEYLHSLFDTSFTSDNYECGMIQYAYFNANFRSIITHEVKLKDIVDDSIIFKILEYIINSNELLRSFIIEKEGKYYFNQFNEISIKPNDILDISHFDLQAQFKIKKNLFSNMIEQLEKVSVLNNFLFSAVIVKNNERDFSLLFAVDHFIFDESSKTVLDQDAHFALSQIENGNTRIKKSKNKLYKDFINDLRYFTTKKRINDYITSTEYTKFKNLNEVLRNQYLESINEPIIFSKPVYFSIDTKDSNLTSENKEAAIFALTIELLKIIFNLQQVPIRVLRNGRHFANKNYYEVIGDFHTSIPLYIENEKDYYDYLISTERQYSINNLNVMAMSLFDTLEGKEITNTLGRSLSFNYLGEFTELEEKEFLNEAKNANFSIYPITGYAVGEKINVMFLNGLPTKIYEDVKNKVHLFSKRYMIEE